MILIDSDLFTNAKACEIVSFVLLDHDSVHLSLDLKDVYKRGPGIWRLKLDLLKDELISAHVDFIEAFPPIHEWWDFLKESIKETALILGREKSHQLDRDSIHITNSLISAQRDFLAGNVLAKQTIDSIESKLKAIILEQQRSVHIRSRAQLHEEGERPSKYFFKLESHWAQKQSNLFLILLMLKLPLKMTSNKHILIFIPGYIQLIKLMLPSKTNF